MKRGKPLFLVALIGVILIASFVSAQSSPVDALRDLFEGTKEVLTSLGEALFGPGPMGFGGEGIFVKILVFLIVLIVCWAMFSTIDIFRTNSWFVGILSFSVALLATRFLVDPDWLRVILLPYSTLGIALATIFPFLIAFLFIESIKKKIVRRVAWVFLGVVFIGLWFTRASEISSGVILVYPAAAIACGLLFHFDGTIQNIKNQIKAEKELSTEILSHLNILKEKREEKRKDLLKEPTTSALYKTIKDEIEDLNKKIQSALKEISIYQST
jgi:hypothetical protein